ncbi:hypothetical protein H5410_012939 [Solanum commersonii]|uniref:Uncharacterized protein n=1 Tax=Solanum commersonii TaxID=4109 RepID=A0A9J6ATR2_SOLCO|nr:hypothetical protein H5410_012939 [Solanum commersonii]
MDQLVPMAKSDHFQGQTSLEQLNPLPILSIFTLAIEPIRLDSHTDAFSRSSPKASKTLFCRFSCAIVHGFFCDLKFQRDLCQNISWTSVNTLVIELVGLDGQTGPFSRSNETYSTPWAWTIKTLAMELVGPDGQTDLFSRSNDPQSM